ncbi:carboxylating nicotinate-nucleotide diphosphorylase [Pontibacter sp. BT310]|uniref:nicotinate-nucleotide diphosphorylase (carboxylating) n=1 Tax=Pontibacter populi TaxID=890055 RepID=A0ABS6X981_9BACT|nr:carboxylating nicotinate-nucleotide diphosphorylase [Pontibacter populi]MBJ6117692.1 carboxylating nicotinate-nucleotide diphosphorylase [Pontibacter sp. BT310]MBR0570118.1 carboxylating nicotinate-nucleotide diphosphorylase [Microvirga sp. STS03]MBW3364544.1 carboxylating nicotinate-nucleotide diphosphorylase [Pontibacter populi]
MRPTYLTEKSISDFIAMALAEDIGDGDHSSLASIPGDAQNQARLLVKGDGILAGVELAGYIFNAVDPTLQVEVLLQDGATIKYGDVALTVKGKAQSILTAERLVLNCMQRMSGIATYTHHLTELIKGTGAKLLDTRKTTPNFRIMEKWAVVIGGGHNHRFGLFDMIILKDNHVDYAGGIKEAIVATQQYLQEKGKDLRIEVETRNLEEVKQAIETGGIHRIMLDNMTPEMMREAVDLIGGKFETEASGGITETTIRSVAECGVDYISVGALTHSIKSIDLSLKAYKL